MIFTTVTTSFLVALVIVLHPCRSLYKFPQLAFMPFLIFSPSPLWIHEPPTGTGATMPMMMPATRGYSSRRYRYRLSRSHISQSGDKNALQVLPFGTCSRPRLQARPAPRSKDISSALLNTTSMRCGKRRLAPAVDRELVTGSSIIVGNFVVLQYSAEVAASIASCCRPG